eukprot:c8276_g1_i1.p1 GENE.c8276_g1_i1~~c8276_g1_i1.p1  ORF type:complete len:338 (+),score=81.66 c8276_g1_i1:90-1016(+)
MSSSDYVLTPTYGKQSVPVFKIRKQGQKHSVTDMMIRIMLEGQVSKSWLTGDNSEIVPTETQKNTCYALALNTDFDSIEDYGLALARDMLERHKHISKVNLDISERKWERVQVGGQPHNHVFMCSPRPNLNTTEIAMTRSCTVVRSGVSDMRLMKTTQSGFLGYVQDKYTNLKPVGEGTSTPDRIMCTDMIAWWEFAPNKQPEKNFVQANTQILQTALDTFAGNPTTGVFSKSLQETVYKMATNILNTNPLVNVVHFETPNVHHYLYDLGQFGMQNNNVVFQSTDSVTTASGRIVTTLSRKCVASSKL